MQASPFIMTPNNNITEEILMRKEYFAQYYSEVYNITIDKTNSNIIIRNNCYEIKLDKQTLSLLTKVIFNTIDDMFTFLLNIFNQNKYYIKQILNNKMILVIGVYNMIEGREKEIELELKENFEDKNYLIKELFNRYSKMEKNIKEVNYNNQILKQENNKLIQENMNLKIDLENVKNNYGGIQMQINNIMNMINQIQQQLNQFNEQCNKINQQINQINFNNNNNKINEEEKNDELINLKFYCFDEDSQQYSIIIKCKPDDILQEQIMKFRQKDEHYKNDINFISNAEFLDEKKFNKIKHLHLPSFNKTISITVMKVKYHFKIKFIISNENFFVNEYEYNKIEKVSEVIKKFLNDTGINSFDVKDYFHNGKKLGQILNIAEANLENAKIKVELKNKTLKIMNIIFKNEFDAMFTIKCLKNEKFSSLIKRFKTISLNQDNYIRYFFENKELGDDNSLIDGLLHNETVGDLGLEENSIIFYKKKEFNMFN